MEGKKQQSGSSSFVSDLFGSKEPMPSGLFGSIFAPQPKVLGRDSLRSETSLEKKQESYKSESMSRAEPPENYYSRTIEEEKRRTSTGTGTANKWTGSYSQEQKLQPCPLSSSIYYGGQDLYAYPQKYQDYYSYSAYNKDEEDDSGSASRGNWWQGSLYY